MADFEYVSINTTAEKIERIANMDIDDVTLDENSTDNSLPTSKLVFDTIKNESVPRKRLNSHGAPFSSVLAVNNDDPADNGNFPSDSAYKYIDVHDVDYNGKHVESAYVYTGKIPTRGAGGNLWTGMPIDDADCVPKKYVDNAIKNAGGGGTGGGTTDYQELDNKPKINDVELNGEMTANDLSLVDKGTFDKTIGDTETTLDKIIEIQEAYINGNYVNGVTITDKTTSLNYKLYVDNGKLKMEVI